MLLEDQRFLSEDIERLESAIADRIGEEPKHVRGHPILLHKNIADTWNNRSETA